MDRGALRSMTEVTLHARMYHGSLPNSWSLPCSTLNARRTKNNNNNSNNKPSSHCFQGICCEVRETGNKQVSCLVNE